ncbi:HpcH/HpaI aldolase family protein [Ramlibacter sp.]|uniref:HpcH/HpaI aldolase family protein n=1 Tax=Ramlibacter sp. TaxID=1917967 RepID=UPI003D0A337B
MAGTPNHMLACMQSGAVAHGVGLRQARTADTGRAMRTAGCDWLFIDTEHNAMHLDTAAQLSVAAQDAGVTPVVRVPGRDYALANRLLDNGAMAIVMPHVDSGEQAAEFARACRYPPLGKRSVAAGLPQIGFASMPLRDAVAAIESRILLFPMVETREGAAAARDIAATPGLDGILLGLTDLSMELGVPGDVGHASVRAVVENTLAACRAHGKWVGVGGVGDPALLRGYIAQGMNFALIGNDLGLLMAAVTARIAALSAPTGPAA